MPDGVRESSPEAADASQQAARLRHRSWIRLAAAVVALAVLNVAAYWAMGTEPVRHAIAALQSAVYLGAFGLAFLSNLTVLIPIPYNAIVLQMMAQAPMPWLVAVCAAAGSVLGETSGFLAGRAGKGSVEGTRFGRWIGRQLTHPARAFITLVLVAAPPNPAFDVAGLAAGTLGVSWRIFYSAVFVGRLIRFMAFVAFAAWLAR